MNDIFTDLKQKFELLGICCYADEPLSGHSSFHIGGPARLMVRPDSEEKLCCVLKFLKSAEVRHKVTGYGSNILFADSGYNGVIVTTVSMKKLIAHGNYIEAECGVSCNAAAVKAADTGLSGLEFAFGIPGSCGGAVYMNAGAFGSEMKNVVESVRCFDTEQEKTFTLAGDALDFSYRHSLLTEKENYIITGVKFRLEQGNRDDIKRLMEVNMSKRRATQPLELPSAGSIFKRDRTHIVSKIIDDCGLKGFTVGGAQVSEKHAGFIVNISGATSSDVLTLISHIKKIVNKKYGFEPECEIRYIK